MLIQKTPLSERPRERCLRVGPESLSLRECLALLLNSGPRGQGCLGLAEEMLEAQSLSEEEQMHRFFENSARLSPGLLKERWKLGPAAQARLLAALELARRYSGHLQSKQAIPQDARPKAQALGLSALRQIPPSKRLESHEWLGFVPYYRSGKMGQLCQIEKGVRTHVNTDPTEIFSKLLMLRPVGFFLAHNHPSGDLSPSEADFILTRRVRKLASEFEIALLGHWIVSAHSETWISAQC